MNLIGSCTERKRIPPAPRLRLGSLPKSNAPPLTTWLQALASDGEPEIPARELYGGDHWAVLCSAAAEPGVDLWAASAGYGLIPAEAPLKAYSATFAPGHPDSVPTLRSSTATGQQLWWEGLCQARGGGGVRGLAESSPASPLVIAASEPYIRAMERDLLEARGALERPELLVICSIGSRRVDWMSEHQPAVDGRLKAALGGSDISSNARLARFLVQTRTQHRFERSLIKSLLERTAEGFPQRPRFFREKLPDDLVLLFIQDELRCCPELTASVALRRLRSSGRACEQSRFSQLFARAKGVLV